MNDFFLMEKHGASTNNWWSLLDGTNTTPSNKLVPLPLKWWKQKKLTIGEKEASCSITLTTQRKVASSILSAWCLFFCLGFVHSIFRFRIFLYILRTFWGALFAFPLSLAKYLGPKVLGLTLFFFAFLKYSSPSHHLYFRAIMLVWSIAGGAFFYVFSGLSYQGKDIVFRFSIEYSILRDFFWPLGNNRSTFAWGFFKDDILACVENWD
jgi:hypothetical protein